VIAATPASLFAGIKVRGADALVSQNYVTITNGETGIYVVGDRARIEENKVKQSVGIRSGIGIRAESTDAIILGNHVENFAKGIRPHDHRAKIVSNTLYDNRLGVELPPFSELGITLEDTHIGMNGFNTNAVAISFNQTGTRTIIRDNIGFVTENWGATSVADGGTISHGLAGTPDTVQCTTSITDEFCSVTALAATTFTVTITKHDGTAGTTQTIYWYAVFIP